MAKYEGEKRVGRTGDRAARKARAAQQRQDTRAANQAQLQEVLRHWEEVAAEHNIDPDVLHGMAAQIEAVDRETVAEENARLKEFRRVLAKHHVSPQELAHLLKDPTLDASQVRGTDMVPSEIVGEARETLAVLARLHPDRHESDLVWELLQNGPRQPQSKDEILRQSFDYLLANPRPATVGDFDPNELEAERREFLGDDFDPSTPPTPSTASEPPLPPGVSSAPPVAPAAYNPIAAHGTIEDVPLTPKPDLFTPATPPVPSPAATPPSKPTAPAVAEGHTPPVVTPFTSTDYARYRTLNNAKDSGAPLNPALRAELQSLEARFQASIAPAPVVPNPAAPPTAPTATVPTPATIAPTVSPVAAPPVRLPPPASTGGGQAVASPGDEPARPESPLPADLPEPILPGRSAKDFEREAAAQRAAGGPLGTATPSVPLENLSEAERKQLAKFLGVPVNSLPGGQPAGNAGQPPQPPAPPVAAPGMPEPDPVPPPVPAAMPAPAPKPKPRVSGPGSLFGRPAAPSPASAGPQFGREGTSLAGEYNPANAPVKPEPTQPGMSVGQFKLLPELEAEQQKWRDMLRELDEESTKAVKNWLDTIKRVGQSPKEIQREAEKKEADLRAESKRENLRDDLQRKPPPSAEAVPSVVPRDPIQRRAFLDMEAERKEAAERRERELDERRVHAARVRMDPAYRQKLAEREQQRAEQEEQERMARANQQTEDVLGMTIRGLSQAGMSGPARLLNLIGGIAAPRPGRRAAGGRGTGGTGGGGGGGGGPNDNWGWDGASAGGSPGNAPVAASGAGGTGPNTGLGRGGLVGMGMMQGVGLAAGPAGLAIEAIEQFKKAILGSIDTVGKFGAAILKVDADGFAEELINFTKKIPLVGEIVGGLGDAFMGLLHATDSTAARLAQYNPALAAQQAINSVRDIVRDIERAQTLGPELLDYMQQRQEQKEKLEDIVTELSRKLIPLVTFILERINIAIGNYEDILGIMADILDSIPGSSLVPGIGAIANSLHRIANNTTPALNPSGGELINLFNRLNPAGLPGVPGTPPPTITLPAPPTPLP